MDRTGITVCGVLSRLVLLHEWLSGNIYWTEETQIEHSSCNRAQSPTVDLGSVPPIDSYLHARAIRRDLYRASYITRAVLGDGYTIRRRCMQTELVAQLVIRAEHTGCGRRWWDYVL